MEAERWRIIERLYHDALEQEPGCRRAFLAQACEGDESLEREVESLLTQLQDESFLASPALEVAAKALAHSSSSGATSIPSVIGRYRIVRLLGEGGMGIVYEAEQEEPHRVVALKVIRSGLATPAGLRRFRQESQALARLQHPGIAQVYESNIADEGLGQQPFFAMEFIRGLPLQQYADVHGLDARQKLQLMVKICEAVHHAHQRGLIHRDLKPGNIVVDETGQPKILDFGVARMSEADSLPTIQTEAGQLVGTLAYMSPEQMLGDPLEVDTRSDVYSLGVILYEFLSGKLPYEVKRHPLPEAVRVIREEDPASLSSINRQFRGDVETIVDKALEKDKALRYASAADLAADLQRYLNDEPIAARPPSATYQLHKFARRHRGLVAGIAALFLVLLAGVAATTSQAVRAIRAGHLAMRERDRATEAEQAARLAERAAAEERNRARAAEQQAIEERNRALREKQRADQESATARAVDDFLRNDLLAQASLSKQARPGASPNPDLTVRSVLDRAAASIAGRFDKQPLVEASIRQTIGNTYLDLGLYPQAQIQMERAYEIRSRRLGEEHPDTLQTMNNLAALYIDQNKGPQAEPLLNRAWQVRRRTLGEENPETLVTLNNLAALDRMDGKYPEAELLYKRGLEIRRRVLGENHRSTALTMHNLASLYRLEGKYAEAEPLQTRSLEIWRGTLGEEAPETVQGMNNLGALYQAEGRYAEAEALFNRVLEVRRRTLGAQNPNTIDAMTSLGEVQLSQEKYTLAARSFREALSNWQKTGADGWKQYYGEALLGASLAGQKQYADAEPLLVAGAQGLLERQASIPKESRRVAARAAERIVVVYQDWGKPEKAAEWREKLQPK